MPVPIVIDNTGTNTTAGRVTRQNFPLSSDVVLVTSANQANITGGVLPMTIDQYANIAGNFVMDFTQGAINPIVGGGTTSVSVDADGTFTNSSGVLTQATANTARFDYDPVTRALRGLLIEEGRTNLLLNSLLNGTSLSTQNVTTAATPYTLSFYGTGTVTLSGTSTAGPLVGTGAYPNRVSLTFTPTAGTLTLTVSGSVQYAQLEAGSFATSFIPTAGASVARAADNLSLLLGSWFNATEGTFVIEIATPNSTTGSGGNFLIGVSDGTTNEQHAIYLSPTQYTYQLRDGAVTQFTIQPASNSAPTLGAVVEKAAVAYKASDFAISSKGGLVGTSASGTLPTVTTLYLGSRNAGSLYLNGWLRKIYYFNTRLDNATLQRMSA